MSVNTAEIRKLLNYIHKVIENDGQFKAELSSVLERKVNDVKPKIYKEFGVYQQGLIKQIFNEAVDNFYSSYNPEIYERQFDLYNVLSLRLNNYGEVINDTYEEFFDPTDMHPDRRGHYHWDGAGGFESLFDLTFMSGYHGGAADSEDGTHPLTGIPYYRTPHPYYSHWGESAVHSIAPFIHFKTMLDEANRQGGVIDQMFETLGNEHLKGVFDEIVERDIPELEAKYFGRL